MLLRAYIPEFKGVSRIQFLGSMGDRNRGHFSTNFIANRRQTWEMLSNLIIFAKKIVLDFWQKFVYFQIGIRKNENHKTHFPILWSNTQWRFHILLTLCFNREKMFGAMTQMNSIPTIFFQKRLTSVILSASFHLAVGLEIASVFMNNLHFTWTIICKSFVDSTTFTVII